MRQIWYFNQCLKNWILIDCLFVCMLFHLNGIGFFSLVTHKGKTSKVTNPLLPQSTCALPLHPQRYHLKLAAALLRQESSNTPVLPATPSQVKSNCSWNQEDAPVLFLTKWDPIILDVPLSSCLSVSFTMHVSSLAFALGDNIFHINWIFIKIWMVLYNFKL